jgi:ABC-type nitrate/sulfonate/bicarbonate transport system permease component
MNKLKISTKNSYFFFLTLLFVYVALFEFILPVNRILPKPSILAESFTHVFSDYNLLTAILITISVIYLGLIISYITIFLFSAFLFKIFVEIKEVAQSLKLFRYFTLIFFVITFNYWFPEKLFAEYIFASLTALFMVTKKMHIESSAVKKEYLDVAQNLGLTQNKIYKDVYWKYWQPSLAQNYEQIHYSLWGIILLYEFIGNNSGLGYAYRNALLYKDYTAFLIFVIIISILIWIGNSIIRMIKKNMINWADEND